MTDAAQPTPWPPHALDRRRQRALGRHLLMGFFRARHARARVPRKIQLPETERLPVSRGSSLLDISPDGKRIVYAAQSDETTQLYLVPCIRKR